MDVPTPNFGLARYGLACRGMGFAANSPATGRRTLQIREETGCVVVIVLSSRVRAPKQKHGPLGQVGLAAAQNGFCEGTSWPRRRSTCLPVCMLPGARLSF